MERGWKALLAFCLYHRIISLQDHFPSILCSRIWYGFHQKMFHKFKKKIQKFAKNRKISEIFCCGDTNSTKWFTDRKGKIMGRSGDNNRNIFFQWIFHKQNIYNQVHILCFQLPYTSSKSLWEIFFIPHYVYRHSTKRVIPTDVWPSKVFT